MVGILVIAGAGIALGLALRSPTRPATSRSGAARPTTSQRGTAGQRSKDNGTTRAPGGSSAPSITSPPTASSSPTTTPPPPPAPAPTGAPRLTSAYPSGGHAGQTVVVDGSGLFSSNGHVVAYFGGAAAPTSCSSQTSCTVTVPDLGSGRAPVRLTIVTATGRSNPLTFSYS
ncbi:MAG TPA: IPT/TIG domain-containing protein [Acidimicrobiales bacterium]|nr:IPT/TIG domain-containing protein [Acidimicrobiales bacterium]